MSFDRSRLPDRLDYYATQGLKFTLRGKWRTAPCVFHGGSDSMRINIKSGTFVCMAGCGARGGDVLAYHMATQGLDFVSAAKDLGAWVDDGKPHRHRPTPFPVRDALEVLNFESFFVASIAAQIGQGLILSDDDRKRVMTAVGRIQKIAEVFYVG
jgi:hypothetical protein